MKKLLYLLLLTINCSLLTAPEAHAACPSGYSEIDVGNLYVFAAASCTSGYTEVNTPIRLPSPSGSGITGSDDKGSFNYGVCSYQ